MASSKTTGDKCYKDNEAFYLVHRSVIRPWTGKWKSSINKPPPLSEDLTDQNEENSADMVSEKLMAEGEDCGKMTLTSMNIKKFPTQRM